MCSTPHNSIEGALTREELKGLRAEEEAGCIHSQIIQIPTKKHEKIYAYREEKTYKSIYKYST